MRNETRAVIQDLIHKSLPGIGNDLVNELVRNAPVDTSFLRNNIRYEVSENGLIITMPEYGFYVEFGTGERAENGGVKYWVPFRVETPQFGFWHPGMEPQPWIRPVLNDKLHKIVAKNLRRTINGGS